MVADIKALLQNHPSIDNSQTLIVNFNRFGASSLDIMVYAFTLTRAWVDYQALKQELLLAIGRIVASHGAEIAFPTQTLHLASASESTPAVPDPAQA
ncbi:Low conductance mechanosensitive channel YnaI [compost metagenome]